MGGFVESRVRQLVVRLANLPFSAVRPHPITTTIKITHGIQDGGQLVLQHLLV